MDMFVDDFFLEKFSVTCRQYFEFLNSPFFHDKGWTNCIPWSLNHQKPFWPRDESGRIHLPTPEWIEKAPEALKTEAVKLTQMKEWWDGDWPVSYFLWPSAIRYAAWRRSETGYLVTLPHEVQWEKAARGTDGRYFPWGMRRDSSFSNHVHAHKAGLRIMPVDSFPRDESVYGLRGMAGNMQEFCLNLPDPIHGGLRLSRGGTWTQDQEMSRCSFRAGADIAIFVPHGFRMAVLPKMKYERLRGML
jgi:serine/threonine-protein kinase